VRLKSPHLPITIILSEETNMKKYVSPTIHNYGNLSGLIQAGFRRVKDVLGGRNLL
jgi:hypothetical protein